MDTVASDAEIRRYQARIRKNMRRWTDAKLDKEATFSKGDEGGWEAREWRNMLDEELRRRQYL